MGVRYKGYNLGLVGNKANDYELRIHKLAQAVARAYPEIYFSRWSHKYCYCHWHVVMDWKKAWCLAFRAH